MKTHLKQITFALALACATQTMFAQTAVPNIITYQGRVNVGGQPFTGTGQFKFALVSGGTNTSRTATADAHYPMGMFMDVVVTDGGAGYVTPPTVTFSPLNPGGSGGVATAVLTGGSVTAINISSYGSYNGFVSLLMTPPPVALGYATYWSHDNTSAGGSQPTSAVNLPVVNGLFMIPLGDTNQANMAALPANVATNDSVHLRIWFNDGTNGFAQLTPDQPLTAAPYALVAQRAAQLEGTSTAPVTLNNPANSFSGNGAGLTGLWALTGNAGTMPGTHFLGTTDNQALELKVNGVRVLRLEPGAFGSPNIIAGSAGNSVSGYGATIAGGTANTASGFYFPTIGGGADNQASQPYSTIAGGSHNAVSGSYSTIAGGEANSAGNIYSAIGGGYKNSNNGDNGTIGGGNANTNTATVGTIGGGRRNYVSGPHATIPGGSFNNALGADSFAAGAYATAAHNNSFVWGDGSTTISSDAANTFNLLASGGYKFYTGSGAGIQLIPGQTAWISISDRNLKKNFTALDGKAVLAKLAAVPVSQWNYKWEQDTDTLNIGPMAQDFKAAFYPGRDDKGISTLEFDGVELAAIQGLNEKLEEQKTENADLKAQLNELKVFVKKLAETQNK